MAFVPRTFQEILTDMIAWVQSHTEINDFSVGSVIRTTLEAAALEDDEQYFQMVQLLDMFSFAFATGEDLDRRLADFGIVRRPATNAFGKVRFVNQNARTNQLALDASTGSNVLKVFDSSPFPASGYPYVIRVAEGTPHVQDLTVVSLTTASNTFTLSGSTLLTEDVFVGDRVTLVTGASPHTFNAGTNIQAPPTNTERAKVYTTSETAFIAAGNVFSNEVIAKATNTGPSGNTGLGRVTQFMSGPPFQGAGVTNSTAMSGGLSRERDQEFRIRAMKQLQSLSRGTPLAVQSAVLQLEDPSTGQRVISANIREDFAADEVIVFIDDGTGLDPDIIALPQNSLSAVANIGDTTLPLNDGSMFPSSGSVLIGDGELVEFIGKPSANSLTLSSALVGGYPAGTIVRFVDVVSEGSESGQQRFRVQNYPVVRATDRIWIKDPGSASWVELVRGTDFELNKGTGDFIILDPGGLYPGTEVVASYNYYTNLIAEAQKVLEGSPSDYVNYPGVKAAGIVLSVEAPVIRRITVRATISALPSYNEEDLVPNVRTSIEGYISGLKIGDDVIRSKIIDAAFDVQGVKDVVVTLPASNIVVLENELPVPFDASGNSLVTVL